MLRRLVQPPAGEVAGATAARGLRTAVVPGIRSVWQVSVARVAAGRGDPGRCGSPGSRSWCCWPRAEPPPTCSPAAPPTRPGRSGCRAGSPACRRSAWSSSRRPRAAARCGSWSRAGRLAFSPVSPAAQAAGNPLWTADLMVGGSYVFIYIAGRPVPGGVRPPAGLGAVPAALQPRGRISGGTQLSATVKAGGRVFGQFRDMGSGRVPVRGQRCRPGRAGLARRDPAQPWAPAGRVLVTPAACGYPNSAGSWPRCAAASSSRLIVNWPVTSRAAPPVAPMTAAGTPLTSQQLGKVRLSSGPHGHYGAGGRLAEQLRAGVARQGDGAACAAAQAGFGEGDGQPAVRQVMRALEQAARQPRRPARKPAHARPPGRPRAAGRPGARGADAPTATRRTQRGSRRAARPGGPARRTDAGSRRRTSSCTPRTPMTGVGWMAALPVWL